MNTRAVSIATIACIVLGGWLPSLWLPAPAQKVRSILPSSAAREPAWQSLQTKVRSAGSAMKLFQAVITGVRGRGAALAFHAGDLGDLVCEEAEELAVRLAGEQLAAQVTDGPAFLKSLRECDYHAREAALEAWADADPDAALTTLIASASDSFGVEANLIQRLAARDPDKALALLRATPKTTAGSSARSEVWNAVLAACAGKGTDYALAAILSAPHEAQEQGLDSLLRVMAVKDPRATLAWCETLPPELQGSLDPASIFETWGRTDPVAALSEWVGTGNLATYPTGKASAVAWAARDPEAFIQWVATQGESGSQFMGIAARAMARRDPQRAAAMAAQLSPKVLNSNDGADSFANDGRRDVLRAVGEEWAQKDASAALTWARSLPAAERSWIIDGLLPHLTGLPPEERRALAHELGTDTATGFQLLWDVDRDEAIKVFASMKVDQRLYKYASRAYGSTAESLTVAANLLQGIIQDFPAAPAEAAQSSNSRDLSRHVAQLTGTWAARDPAAAAAWVSQLPPGESQSTAAANVALTWGRYDLPAARAWVAELPAGPARDKAGAHLAELTAASGEE